jgi:magnesium chelatase subunit D
MTGTSLPFSAVVGQEQAKLALILAAVERRIGGVLLRGDKGSAKSTLARGLAALLPGRAPFVELPLGATEDRVVGTIDLAAALTEGDKRFDPGLLHAADGGVLYVDEINLLPDHLVDVLLDVAASGVNRVEREGVSHTHPSRFVLVGSMNPEEGDLRPQLLDRFGLAVDVRTPSDTGERAAALRRRLDFDDPDSGLEDRFAAEDARLAAQLAACRSGVVPGELVEAVAALCASVGAEGLRADLTICRAAAALAGWEGRLEASAEDVRRVAALALAHRARRDPFDPAGMEEQRLEQALDETLGPQDSAGTPESGSQGPGRDEDQVDAPRAGLEAPSLAGSPATRPGPRAAGRHAPSPAARGRVVGARRPDGPVGSVAVGATVRAAAARRGAPGANPALVEAADVREAVREQRSANLIVIAVDASGSMGAQRRMEAAKGLVMSLLRDAYQRRDLVALVTFRDDEAQVVLRPTGSVEVARARLTDLPTGGRTPLAAGIRTGLEVASAPSRLATHDPLLVVITDARATSGPGGQDPLDAAASAAEQVRRSGVASVVIDVEEAGPAQGGSYRLGLASGLAERMGARYVRMDDLDAARVDEVVRAVTAAGR